MKSSRVKWGGVVLVCILCLTWYYFSLPERLFNDPYATILQSSDGELLNASIADDGQWRFPETDSVPLKFQKAILAFEDKRFLSHPGVDVLSMARALKQNLAAGKIVSGGSTITMQVIRLSRRERRTIFEKIIEVFLATRLELRSGKKEILRVYASHAPFGSNVVGIEAACWRYFGTGTSGLTWGQAALLAVLPNAPALIHPGRNRSLLARKRDALLDKLRINGTIDSLTCALAKEEAIPTIPFRLPREAPHLLARAREEGRNGQRLKTTLQKEIQSRVTQLVNEQHDVLKQNHIHNAAAIVLDVKSGSVLAYVGNVTTTNDFENDVDVVAAPRSTGSILKPFLYAAMQSEGLLLPKTLLSDIPVQLNGFTPRNFSLRYDGAVKADEALTRSLNVPAVNMLRSYRYEKFHSLLQNIGLTTLKNPPDHYGLSLILGGAEGTLWDIAGAYASMARTLINYFDLPGNQRYNRSDFHAPTYLDVPQMKSPRDESSWISSAAIYNTFETLTEVYRPAEEAGWKHFGSARKFAWKTGTSFGFRDGWAIGVTPEYVVGVWVGNADGEGRPGLTGTDAAAPLMFNIFSSLPQTTWFQQPLSEMALIPTCHESGFRASSLCLRSDSIWVVKSGLASGVCTYHKLVHVTNDLRFRVHDKCERLDGITHVPWFTLPPVEEYYFKKVNRYALLPPFRNDCVVDSRLSMMEIVYPKTKAKIFVPRELDETLSSAVFQVAHRNDGAKVFWHLDGEYLATTQKDHQLPLMISPGHHKLTVIDDQGATLERSFEVVAAKR
ncbi:MAG TPA: penicillin-binding protein 1C [Chryseosolibacter sp.]|nr:penicillin-binding protein 1C [Chryseosolibacter sp.]